MPQRGARWTGDMSKAGQADIEVFGRRSTRPSVKARNIEPGPAIVYGYRRPGPFGLTPSGGLRRRDELRGRRRR